MVFAIHHTKKKPFKINSKKLRNTIYLIVKHEVWSAVTKKIGSKLGKKDCNIPQLETYIILVKNYGAYKKKLAKNRAKILYGIVSCAGSTTSTWNTPV